jgi:hypothetical protein
MSEIETPKVVEPSKPSKLNRIKANALMAGIYVIPMAIVGVSLYAGVKTTKMQLDTAKINLEIAKLNKS